MLRLTPEKAVKIVVGVAASLMLFVPVATLLHGSFALEDPTGGTVYSVENYVDVLTDGRIREAFLTTLTFPVGAALVTAFFGIPLAWKFLASPKIGILNGIRSSLPGGVPGSGGYQAKISRSTYLLAPRPRVGSGSQKRGLAEPERGTLCGRAAGAGGPTRRNDERV